MKKDAEQLERAIRCAEEAEKSAARLAKAAEMTRVRLECGDFIGGWTAAITAQTAAEGACRVLGVLINDALKDLPGGEQ